MAWRHQLDRVPENDVCHLAQATVPRLPQGFGAQRGRMHSIGDRVVLGSPVLQAAQSQRFRFVCAKLAQLLFLALEFC